MVLAPIAYAANTPSWVGIGVVQHRQRAGADTAVLLGCRTRSATAVEQRGIWRAREAGADIGCRGGCGRSGGCPWDPLYKGELATNASQSAPPSTMNVFGARPVTNTGAISPSTTNVSTTHTAVGIAPLGIVHHAKDVPLGRVRGGRSSTLSDGIGLDPRRRFVYLRVSQGAALRWQRP